MYHVITSRKRKRSSCVTAPNVCETFPISTDGPVGSPDESVLETTETIAESPLGSDSSVCIQSSPHASNDPKIYTDKDKQTCDNSINEEIDNVLFSSSILEEYMSCNDIEDTQSKDNCDPRKAMSTISNNTSAYGDSDVIAKKEGGQVEEEDGLYPEDFNFIFNTSAFLPQEDSNTKTYASYQQPPKPITGGSVNPCTHDQFTACAESDRVQYPSDTFYGLPLAVQRCLKEFRGISKLYGKGSPVYIVVLT